MIGKVILALQIQERLSPINKESFKSDECRDILVVGPQVVKQRNSLLALNSSLDGLVAHVETVS